VSHISALHTNMRHAQLYAALNGEWVMSGSDASHNSMRRLTVSGSCHTVMRRVTQVISHSNASWHTKHYCVIWHSFIRRHITYEWVTSHMNESCHIWTSHVIHEWVMIHKDESCHIWTSQVTYERVMSHMNESGHIWMSQVTYEWVMSHMNESCHIWMSHVTYEW